MIDYILESLFAVSGTVKHWELDLTDEDNHRYLYTNNDIVSESITINEKLFSITENDSITFGEFSANEFRAKLGYVDIGTFVSLEGMTMKVRVWLNNYSSNMLDIGTYTIVSDKITSDHKMREIIAYDNLSKFNDGDLSEWYHGMFHGDYIVRLHTIFQALIDTMGFICDTNYTNFPNVRIYEQDISNLKPSDLLINICELWAVFPTIGRNGHLQLISLGTPDASDGTHSNLSNPSYPGQINIGVNQYVPPCKSENYNVQAITRVNIRDKNGYVIYQNGEEGNDYYIDNNFLTFGMTQEELERIADFFIGKASIVQYRPYELKTVGNPCRECGDSIEVITPYGTINSYVFSRTLKGGQHLIDTFGAKGTKYRIEKVDTYNPPGGGSGSGSQGGSVSSLTFDNLPELIRNFGLRLLDEPSNVNISLNETSVSLSWSDPIDLTDNKPCPVEWAGTVVVRAEGKAPLNPYRDEYTIVVDSTTRDEYSEEPFVDTVDTDKDYVYAIMPYDTEGHYRYTKSVSISTDYKGDYPEITSITISGASAVVSFTLPSGTWTSIKLVYKQDAIPQDEDDGTAVTLDITDIQKTVTNVYGLNYFVIFASNGSYAIESNVSEFNGDARAVTVYGFHVDSSISDPSNAVTYLEDAIGMTPAHMDYSSGLFDYGSWEDAFFIPRPCMLKTDGIVDYYLDPDDYTKKADGTPSDVADTSYNGNAMMEWGRDGKKIWYKLVPDAGDATSYSVYIADDKVDSSYRAWSFYNKDNQLINHFYTACYTGSLLNNKLRSISGQNLMHSQTVPSEITYARANGNYYNIEHWSDMSLMFLLLYLMGKSLDVQTVFGNGHIRGGASERDLIPSGQLNSKGLFYGYSDNTHKVKVFGMEDIWGEQWRRVQGLMNNNGAYYYKLTEGTADGSTANGYRTTDTSGMLYGGTAPAIEGYISKMKVVGDTFLPSELDGTEDTYYCDYYFPIFRGTSVLNLGGRSTSGKGSGFFLALSDNINVANWSTGASLSLKK